MGFMQVTVKVRYGCSKDNFESFGNNRYLVYLISKEDEPDAMDELMAVLSKKLGAPRDKIQLKQKASYGMVFEVF